MRLFRGGGTYNYDYDPIGNRLSEIKDLLSGISTNLYASNELNQYTNIANGSVVEPQYDLDGNMTSYNGWTFTWNGENRLIAASNGTTVIENAYDYMGRRITKTTKNQAQGTTNQTQFVYDGWNLISESKVQGLESNVSYFVWGLDLSGSMQGAGGIGGLLATIEDGEAYFSCFDANGNLTDYVGTNGTVVAHYEYDAFGNTITATGDKKDDFKFRFSSKYLDVETGWYYYGYRYYSPELGRWPNRDPIGEQGGKTIRSFDQSGVRAPSHSEVLRLRTDLLMGASEAVAAGLPDVANLQLIAYEILGMHLNEVLLNETENFLNVYKYVRNDPVGLIDPYGLACWTNPFTGTHHGLGTWKAVYNNKTCTTRCSKCVLQTDTLHSGKVHWKLIRTLGGERSAADCENYGTPPPPPGGGGTGGGIRG